MDNKKEMKLDKKVIGVIYSYELSEKELLEQGLYSDYRSVVLNCKMTGPLNLDFEFFVTAEPIEIKRIPMNEFYSKTPLKKYVVNDFEEAVEKTVENKKIIVNSIIEKEKIRRRIEHEEEKKETE